MLTKYEHLVILPVHPTVLVNYRKSFRPSEQRTLRAMLGSRWISMLHRDKLRQLDLDTSETRTLQFLVEERRKLDTLFKSAYRASEDVLPSGARLVR